LNENAIPVIEAATHNPPILKRSEAGNFADISAKTGPQNIFTKLLIEVMTESCWYEMSWASASRGLRQSNEATKKKFRNSEQYTSVVTTTGLENPSI
jgi:hypothetical protein